MNLGQTLRMALMLECSICRENRQADDFETGYNDVVMFGIVASYTVCPNCLHAVSPDVQTDPEYRRRCRVGYFERFQMTIRETSGVARGAMDWPQIAYTRTEVERPNTWISDRALGIYKGYPYGEYAKSKSLK